NYPAAGAGIRGGAVGGRRNPSLIRDLVTGQVIRPA
ncbi:tRNA threonylcarbamoyladenosine biosynthesis protein RimN, partial [Pseudomonas aeruginosa]|nr:tRNA threonylcarbamoyladenosine biosynthesis protein RimN [Pseudomonas aeruginosa]